MEFHHILLVACRLESIFLEALLGFSRPCSIYQFSNLAPRLSGQNCKFFKLFLSLSSQNRPTPNLEVCPEAEGFRAMLEYSFDNIIILNMRMLCRHVAL